MKKRLWFIIVLVILVVAVVLTIVFINLFREKDTAELTSNVHSVTQSGYLNPENENNTKVDSYLASLKALDDGTYDLGDDQTKIANYIDAFAAFETMGQFFDRQIAFSKYSTTYGDNQAKIEKSFASAQSAVNSLVSYIDTKVELADPSDYWLSQTWTDTEGWVDTIYTSTWDALSRLMKVYEASVTSKLMNNDLTSVIFDGVETLEAVIEENISSTAGSGLKTFVSAYFSQSYEATILGYSYSSTLQNKVASLLTDWQSSTYYESFITGNLA